MVKENAIKFEPRKSMTFFFFFTTRIPVQSQPNPERAQVPAWPNVVTRDPRAHRPVGHRATGPALSARRQTTSPSVNRIPPTRLQRTVH